MRSVFLRLIISPITVIDTGDKVDGFVEAVNIFQTNRYGIVQILLNRLACFRQLTGRRVLRYVRIVFFM
ncbi:hypothetical protein Barb7_02865 [Bacteroidales bacterium Barb7]|nr:hypothetical protein Barb7_02865 [Bacteroidales bacterium Barb7]